MLSWVLRSQSVLHSVNDITLSAGTAPSGYDRRGFSTGTDELGKTVTEAAERLGVSRPSLSELVNEKRSVSPRMALKLGRFFGNGTELWLNMQTRHDRWEVEHDAEARREADRVEPVSG